MKKKTDKTTNRVKTLPGLSRKTAIIAESIGSEYAYLTKLLGEQGNDWVLEQQTLTHAGDKSYDVLDIILKDGTRHSYWFDITSFFGKF